MQKIVTKSEATQSGKMPNNNKYMSFDRHFNISPDLTRIESELDVFHLILADIIYMEYVPNILIDETMQ